MIFLKGEKEDLPTELISLQDFEFFNLSSEKINYRKV